MLCTKSKREKAAKAIVRAWMKGKPGTRQEKRGKGTDMKTDKRKKNFK
jgi:hypothetical protein